MPETYLLWRFAVLVSAEGCDEHSSALQQGFIPEQERSWMPEYQCLFSHSCASIFQHRVSSARFLNQWSLLVKMLKRA